MRFRSPIWTSRAVALALLAAQPSQAAQQQPPAEGTSIGDKAENVARQPLKDVGMMRANPPQLLIDAQAAPYSLAGLRGCRALRTALAELEALLGPDVDEVDPKGEALSTRLAEAGASTLVNGLIPFRGLVREASGAAEADRRLRAMILAATARRGFLKGVAQTRKCPD